MSTFRPSPVLIHERSALMKTLSAIPIYLALLGMLAGCGGKYSGIGGVAGDATLATLKANEHFSQSLKLDDPKDFDDAKRGLIARPSGKITSAEGEVLIDFDAFTFVEGKAPATVNPSLWRHAILNAQIGLFKVTEGIYQLRGFDIANMTLIEGNTGWIVVDPLTCRESAAAAIAFARKHLGDKPVSAIIFTHSHIDHFGGVFGVTSPQEAAERKIPVIAPDGFMEEATSENILVGTAMGRRSGYQFGKDLERSAKGMVDTGLGKAVAYGNYGILPPNRIIKQPKEDMVIDGVRFVFYNVPGAEAPAELTFLLPDKKAYCGAEILGQTMHNLLPVRGAKVRDALRWANYLDQALEQTADAEVCFRTRTTGRSGAGRASPSSSPSIAMSTNIRTTRRCVSSTPATLPREIADMIKLPKSLETYLASRGYYGDLRHNVKAVYQFYMGFYDGNPANLNPLPPEESAKRYLELARRRRQGHRGGAGRIRQGRLPLDR